MSNTIITIEIAQAIKAALAALVPAGTTLYVDGAKDTVTGDQDKWTPPCVVVVVNECLPQQYRSVLREYPVMIYAETWYPEDKHQAALYTLGHAIGQWLAEPALTLTLANFDALTLDTSPERDVDGNAQFFRWNIIVHTRKATS